MYSSHAAKNHPQSCSWENISNRWAFFFGMWSWRSTRTTVNCGEFHSAFVRVLEMMRRFIEVSDVFLSFISPKPRESIPDSQIACRWDNSESYLHYSNAELRFELTWSGKALFRSWFVPTVHDNLPNGCQFSKLRAEFLTLSIKYECCRCIQAIWERISELEARAVYVISKPFYAWFTQHWTSIYTASNVIIVRRIVS